MRRRAVLASGLTGFSAALAGCGYAYGGGDVRERTSVAGVGPAPRSSQPFDTTADQIAVMNSGHHFVTTGRSSEFIEATTVEVLNREGEQRWEFRHRAGSTRMALGDRVYLYDEDGRVVAGEYNANTDDAGEAWRVRVGADEPRLEAGHDGVYLGATDRLLAVRNGGVAWEHSLSGATESLSVVGPVVVVTTPSTMVGLERDGERRWQRQTGGEFSMTAVGDRLLVWATAAGSSVDGAGGAVLDIETGETRWTADVSTAVTHAAATEDRVALSTGRELAVYDTDTGKRQWSYADSRLEGPVVVGPEGVYTLGDDCTGLAVDGDGRRWDRELEPRDCTGVAGWLTGETVAFLFESREIIRLQRTDQRPGLLW